VEVLYPILGSIPGWFGVAATTIEIFSPILMAVAAVGALAILASEFRDWRVAVLSVAFAAGWFAIYRMGADFHGQLLAFPLLLLATTLVLRIQRTAHLPRDLALFILLVGLAALAHIETTLVFLAIWTFTFLAFNLRTTVRRRSLTIALVGSLLIAIPVVPYVLARFPITLPCAEGCSPYPILPAYWLEVLGPAAPLVVLGLALCVNNLRKGGSDQITNLIVVWSLLTLAIGSLGYLFPWFDIAYSDRTLLMLPVPLLSAVATVWMTERGGFLARHANLIMLLVVLIPLVTAPAVFAYIVPQRFRYYPNIP